LSIWAEIPILRHLEMSGIVVHEKKLPHYGAAFMVKERYSSRNDGTHKDSRNATPVPASPGTGADFYRTSRPAAPMENRVDSGIGVK
ncbi:MAG: hypothetical protein FWD31_07085, partial [Planctomycetaceae bacterium]|nr:hypothetical protein [Planctomycetaceae bacterium]